MGGQRIDDHASWVGAAPKGKVFPDGAKTKSYTSSEGAAELADYEDTSEAIQRVQKKGDSQAKSHPMKPGYRY